MDAGEIESGQQVATIDVREAQHHRVRQTRREWRHDFVVDETRAHAAHERIANSCHVGCSHRDFVRCLFDRECVRGSQRRTLRARTKAVFLSTTACKRTQSRGEVAHDQHAVTAQSSALVRRQRDRVGGLHHCVERHASQRLRGVDEDWYSQLLG